MADWGAKITRTGADVSSVDLKDYVLHSGYKTMKALPREEVTWVWTGGSHTSTKVITHGLAYAPLTFIMVKGAGNKWYNVLSPQVVMLTTGSKYARIGCTSNALYFLLNGYSSDPPATNATITVSYYTVIDQL